MCQCMLLFVVSESQAVLEPQAPDSCGRSPRGRRCGILPGSVIWNLCPMYVILQQHRPLCAGLCAGSVSKRKGSEFQELNSERLLL